MFLAQALNSIKNIQEELSNYLFKNMFLKT